MDKPTVIPMTPEESLNEGFDAIPHSGLETMDVESDDFPDDQDPGEMNEADARASGYIDNQGKAVEMAKPDVNGSPTGAYTDIGAGRSSVVHKH